MNALTKLGRFLGILPPPPPNYDPATLAAVRSFAAQLTLYHFYSCPYCAHVHLALRRLGVEPILRDVSMVPANRDELVAGGGRATVPSLRIEAPDGSVTWMYESKAIISWLDRRILAIQDSIAT